MMANRTKAAFVVLDRDGILRHLSLSTADCEREIKQMSEAFTGAHERPGLGPRFRIVDAVVTYKSTKSTKEH